MDAAERVAFDHLKSRGFTNIVHEPDGNVPPDFLLDGRIAVEVRRLNQRESGGSTRSLSETSIPLSRQAESLLKSLGPPRPHKWFVTISFQRPLPAWRTLKPDIESFLKNHQLQGKPRSAAKFDNGRFEVEVFARSTGNRQAFTLGGTSDQDSGGWVIEELDYNIKLCVDEKTKKIQKFRSGYPEWWLVLIDFIDYGISDFDWQQFKANNTIKHNWQKLVLVNPLDPNRYRDL